MKTYCGGGINWMWFYEVCGNVCTRSYRIHRDDTAALDSALAKCERDPVGRHLSKRSTGEQYWLDLCTANGIDPDIECRSLHVTDSGVAFTETAATFYGDSR